MGIFGLIMEEKKFTEKIRESATQANALNETTTYENPSKENDPIESKSQEKKDESTDSAGGNTIRYFGFIALAIYFIWGQGFACIWWMWFIFITLALLVFSNKVKLLQVLIGLFLIGITFFASPTFGYDKEQTREYRAGFSEGRSNYRIGCVDCDPDWAWEQKEERASVDISQWKKFYIRGYKRGYSGKKE